MICDIGSSDERVANDEQRTTKREWPTTNSERRVYALTLAASNRFRNSIFFSAGRNDASKELRASSRKWSSEKLKVRCTSSYSSTSEVRNMAGTSVLIVSIRPSSK